MAKILIAKDSVDQLCAELARCVEAALEHHHAVMSWPDRDRVRREIENIVLAYVCDDN